MFDAIIFDYIFLQTAPTDSYAQLCFTKPKLDIFQLQPFILVLLVD